METIAFIESVLKVVLLKDKSGNIIINNVRQLDQGNNFFGNIFYVEATDDIQSQLFYLVLKVSKQDLTLRKNFPMKLLYLNEIFMYETMFPSLLKLQSNLNDDEKFCNLPICLGSYVDDNVEVIVLEDLAKKNYFMWNKTQPMPQKYINLVVESYAKLHATAAVLPLQERADFKLFFEMQLRFKNNEQRAKILKNIFIASYQEMYDLVKEDLPDLDFWIYKNQLDSTYNDIFFDCKNFQTVIHMDCWNNNFMFQLKDENIADPQKVIIIDWQFMGWSSPILDLSYFLCSCMLFDSELFPDVLNNYYETFADTLHKLNMNAESVYSKNQFLKDWINLCAIGAVFSFNPLKMSVIGDEEIPDVTKTVQQGGSVSDTFQFKVKNNESLKERVLPIVKYLINNNYFKTA